MKSFWSSTAAASPASGRAGSGVSSRGPASPERAQPAARKSRSPHAGTHSSIHH